MASGCAPAETGRSRPGPYCPMTSTHQVLLLSGS